MNMPGRTLSFLSVAVLVVAAGLAALLSVNSTSGQVRFAVPASGSAGAARHLGSAVENDLAAGSFVVQVTTLMRRPERSGPERYTMVYQAPDRSELIVPETAAGGVLITVGEIRYSEPLFTPAGPEWVSTEVPSGEPAGGGTATVDLTALRDSTDVVQHGSSYRVVEVDEVVTGSLQARSQGVGEDEDVLTATVENGRVVREVVDNRSQKSSVQATFLYGEFGSAPAIEVPPAQRMILCGGRPIPQNFPCPKP